MGYQPFHVTQEQLRGYYERTLSLREEMRLLEHGRQCTACNALLMEAPHLEVQAARLALLFRREAGEEIPDTAFEAVQTHFSRPTLEAYARGDVSRELREQIENHLLECDNCYGEVELIRWVNSMNPDSRPLGADFR